MNNEPKQTYLKKDIQNGKWAHEKFLTSLIVRKMPIKPPEDNSLLHKSKLLLNKIGTTKNTKEKWVCRSRRQPLHSGDEAEIKVAILKIGMKTSQKVENKVAMC